MLRRAALSALLLPLVACSSGGSADSSAPVAPVAPVASGAPAAASDSSTVWLCRPGLAENPCEGGLDATVMDGSQAVEPHVPAADPAIDCFYVYPTVSDAVALNAPRVVDDKLIGVARAQAARFSEVCRVFAPVYRQITLTGISTGHYGDVGPRGIAEGDVKTAWEDYLANDNDGRGVVLIGHSQGARTLTGLLAEEIEDDPAALDRLVSAVLVGGDVTVAAGQDTGGSFSDVTACRTPGQLGCVIAYSSFLAPPPEDSYFARSPEPGREVLCTDPTLLAGTPRSLDPYLPSETLAPAGALAAGVPGITTGFGAFPGQLVAECRAEDGADYLHVAPAPGGGFTPTNGQLGPRWGLHNLDVNLALGDLVEAVRQQAEAYEAGGA